MEDPSWKSLLNCLLFSTLTYIADHSISDTLVESPSALYFCFSVVGAGCLQNYSPHQQVEQQHSQHQANQVTQPTTQSTTIMLLGKCNLQLVGRPMQSFLVWLEKHYKASKANNKWFTIQYPTITSRGIAAHPEAPHNHKNLGMLSYWSLILQTHLQGSKIREAIHRVLKFATTTWFCFIGWCNILEAPAPGGSPQFINKLSSSSRCQNQQQHKQQLASCLLWRRNEAYNLLIAATAACNIQKTISYCLFVWLFDCADTGWCRSFVWVVLGWFFLCRYSSQAATTHTRTIQHLSSCQKNNNRQPLVVLEPFNTATTFRITADEESKHRSPLEVLLAWTPLLDCSICATTSSSTCIFQYQNAFQLMQKGSNSNTSNSLVEACYCRNHQQHQEMKHDEVDVTRTQQFSSTQQQPPQLSTHATTTCRAATQNAN